MNKLFALLVGVLMLGSLSACTDNTREGAEESIEHTAEETEKAADDAATVIEQKADSVEIALDND